MQRKQMRYQPGRRSRALLWSGLGALAVHVALAFYLWSQGLLPHVWEPLQKKSALVGQAGPHGPSVDGDGLAQGANGGESAEAATLLRKEMKFVQRLTRHELEAELQRQVDKIGTSVRADQIPAMTRFIESAVGVDRNARAYEPRAEVSGRFDSKTATLYDITRQAVDAGDVQYEVVLVDADGRTLIYSIPAAQMTADMVRAYRVFALARRNPALRPLVDLSRKLGTEWIVKERQGE